ncbi:hypothetical protein WA026_003052 [Henosepilachna vigintioctopunctata]|uniref:Uncharacterized protein n=1 Tax=Henosepilachna vigintioctopunctata TaxID=420089 RepID=A0AAW1TNH6_9CUCU
MMYSAAFDLHDYCLKTKMYNLYQTVFEDVYKKSLFENKKLITENLLEVIPVVEKRKKNLYKNVGDFRERVDIYLKSNNSALRSIKFEDEVFKDVKFQGEFLKDALKQNGYKPHNTHSSIEITLAIRDWNKRHPDHFILSYKVIENVEKSFVDVHCLYHARNGLISMKYPVCRESALTELANVYFNRMDNVENITMTKRFWKYTPDISISEEHIDHVVEYSNLKTGFHLMKYLRKYNLRCYKKYSVIIREN